MKSLLCLAILTVMLHAEVSVFGAGDLKSDNPYGLTESEKVIFAIKKSTLENRRAIKALKLQIADMREALDGLRSVVSSLSDKVGQTGQKLHAISSTPKEDLSGEISQLKSELAAQKKENEKLRTALKKVTSMVGKISGDYVSRGELDLLKKKVKSKKSAQSDSRTKVIKHPKTNQQLLADAIKAYRAKKYDLAKSLFSRLDSKNYKRATSNYYLGEIAYYQKAYNDAIVYYKKSANLYDQATYMPTLLLHTALSFKYLGETENAKRFFEAVKATYPGTSQAKLAKKYL